MSVAKQAHTTSAEPIEQLLPRIQPKLKRLISRYGVPHQDVEDLLQQALLAFVYKRETIHNAETWLVGTVRKQCLMYLRSRKRQLYEAVDNAVLECVAEPKLSGQERAEISHDLEKAIAHIPSRCRALLRLRYRLGYDPAEVAKQLGYRSSSIRKVTTRCLAALTRQMIANGFSKDKRDA